MSTYFQNAIVPDASEVEVCDAIEQWHVAQGYQRQSKRLRFDCRHGPDEKRAFVMSNGRSCIVLCSNGSEDAASIRQALNRFPTVVQLWTRDGGWGYRLNESGCLTTSYCSKRGLEEKDEAPSKTPSDLARLSFLCKVPGALMKLKRIESGYHLFNGRRCHEFAYALQTPAALFNFHAVDVANAGIVERRRICGWDIQMLAFQRQSTEGINCGFGLLIIA